MAGKPDRRALWIGAALIAAVVAVYAQVYRHDFIDFDDPAYVSENLHVSRGLRLEGVIWAFTTGHAANWHPLTWLSHMADCTLFGLRPGAHHLVNVLFHAANALLLFAFFYSLTGAAWRSAFVAGLFALHPLHVESVAWLAERKDVLSTFLGLLALWAYARHAQNPATGRYLTALALFGLSLMAKPMLVTLPFVLLLLDYWPLRRFPVPAEAAGGKARRQRAAPARALLAAAFPLVREKIPFFALSAISSVVTYAVQKAGGAVKVGAAMPSGAKIPNALHSYVAYLAKTIWPDGLSAFYPYPAEPYPAWETLAAAAALIAASIWVVRRGARFPYLPVGWFWYLGTLVPVIGIVQVGGQAMADRYTYVPLTGIFVIAAWGLADWAGGRRALRTVAAATGAGALIAGAVLTYRQVGFWRDTMRLFTHALELDGSNYVAHQNLGTAWAKRGDYRKAVEHFAQALRLRPTDPTILVDYGLASYRLGNIDDAIALYSKALTANPDHPYALRNLALALYDRGRYEEAVTYLERARRRTPDNPLLLYVLGNSLARTGRAPEALAAYRQALDLLPNYAEAHAGIGAVLAAQGQAEEAIRSLERAIELKPNYPEAYNNLGVALYRLGRVPEAVDAFDRALRSNPAYEDARRNREAILAAREKPRP